MPSIIWMSKCKLKCVLLIIVRILSRLDNQCCGHLTDSYSDLLQVGLWPGRSNWCSWGPISCYFLGCVESNDKGSGKDTLHCKFGHLFVGSRSLQAAREVNQWLCPFYAVAFFIEEAAFNTANHAIFLDWLQESGHHFTVILFSFLIIYSLQDKIGKAPKHIIFLKKPSQTYD